MRRIHAGFRTEPRISGIGDPDDARSYALVEGCGLGQVDELLGNLVVRERVRDEGRG